MQRTATQTTMAQALTSGGAVVGFIVGAATVADDSSDAAGSASTRSTDHVDAAARAVAGASGSEAKRDALWLENTGCEKCNLRHGLRQVEC